MPLPSLAHLWLAAAAFTPPELGNGEAAAFEPVPGEVAPSEPASLEGALAIPPGGGLVSPLGNADPAVYGSGLDGAIPSELAPGEVDAVELSWERTRALREAAADDPSAAAPGPWVAEREIDLRAMEGGFLLEGRWTIVAERAGWLAGELLGPGIELRSATLDGKRAPVIALPGSTLLAAWIEADRGREVVELRVRAFVPGGLDDRLDLGLLPATRGRLRAAVPGRIPVPVLDGGGNAAFGAAGDEPGGPRMGAFGAAGDEPGGPRMGASGQAAPARLEGNVVWSGASRLLLRLHDPAGAPPPARDTLAVAHVGVGLTVGDAEVRGRAHVQWELRQGELSRVQATLAGVGDDVTVEGPNVASWARSGDVLDVELSGPVSGRVDLDLRWTQAIGAGEETRLPLPRIEPQAWRSESSLQLARDGELEVIPEVAQGTAIAAAALPEWGQGLVEGTPTAAYQHGSGASTGHLDLLRFVPVPGPPTVVDVADTTVATTDEGRVLMKVRYDVRNDRAAHLSVRPPAGLRIIGARVGVETALPTEGDDGAWRIPLRRSLETVDGLLSFPVEVILLGEQAPWERRESRELPLPTLDAPIAASRVTLFLPPRYRSRLEPGERNVVDAFDRGEGLAYGKGVSQGEAVVADALLEEAVQGYLKNDFEGAQAKLEQIEALGVENANVARLRSNIDVIEGKAAVADKGDVTIQRRVKEQAKVRATEDFRRQELLIAEAEQAAQAGDYDRAESQYQAALDLGGKLAKLEQSESVEQVAVNTSVQSQLGSVSKKKVGKKKRKADDAWAGERSRWASGQSFASSNASSLPTGSGSTPTVDEATGAEEEPSLASRRIVADEPPATTVEPEAAVTSEPEAPELDPVMPAPAPDSDFDSVLDGDDAEPEERPHERRAEREREDVETKRIGLRRERTRNSLGTKYKAAGPRGRFARGDAKSSGTALYDFADDSLDGAQLRPDGTASPTTPSEPPEKAPRDAGLPAPEVTASALSVIVPVTGQAVLYQQLLIEANHTQVIEIHARRRLRR